jgi:hypothetical protein
MKIMLIKGIFNNKMHVFPHDLRFFDLQFRQVLPN